MLGIEVWNVMSVDIFSVSVVSISFVGVSPATSDAPHIQADREK